VISYDAGHQREKLGDLSPVGLVLAPPVGLELVGKEEAFQSLVHLGDLLTEILHQGLEREQSPLEFCGRALLAPAPARADELARAKARRVASP
jgi:hypothetical protein